MTSEKTEVIHRPKIFCLGFHKTGTTSLFVALRMLGLRVSGSVGLELSPEALASGEGVALCISVARNVDAAEDMPWPLYYRELDAAFPGAKFILLTRDPDDWYRSVLDHFTGPPTTLMKFSYGADKAHPAGHRAHWIRVMTTHRDEVRAYFAARPQDFLEMSLFAGDGWEKLCPFLGLPAPTVAFPRKNTRADRARLSYRLKNRIFRLFGITVLPERMI